ncbi:hypothetical protein H6G74_19305 [Nostoc spongiaeforme FACHB-130]|uniref:Uncharacterized protein n=1 Tax=Nostoc spongiaeforme FACHB-130 TaxID=1357510 RepID=A0ABR8FYY9_9NOSO|nr:hypothetical protein [Nostoc spongiaeforme]MBD2596462.1 hypothetical protein [Nostoc spongiaeforme FACHB-130]
MANWDLIGELTVSNSWQYFPNEVLASETFRITTTIQNLDDWTTWKFKSAAYLQFIYPNGDATPSHYIRVRDLPTIYEFPIPEPLKTEGYLLRTPVIIRSSRYLPLTPNDMFAQWKFKLEAWL